jgi:hypothetical protein
MRIAAITARAVGGCVAMSGPPRFRTTVSDEFDRKIEMGRMRAGAEPLRGGPNQRNHSVVLANRSSVSPKLALHYKVINDRPRPLMDITSHNTSNF